MGYFVLRNLYSKQPPFLGLTYEFTGFVRFGCSDIEVKISTKTLRKKCAKLTFHIYNDSCLQTIEMGWWTKFETAHGCCNNPRVCVRATSGNVNMVAYSQVNLWFDLDKIATETMFVGTDSHTHPEQHIKNIEQSKYAKVVNLHKFKMATQNQIFSSYDRL